jgi:hypothetical protein
MTSETDELTELVPEATLEAVPDATPVQASAAAPGEDSAPAPFWQRLLSGPGRAIPIALGAAILVLSAGAGFGARWALEPPASDPGELEQAQKKIASLAAEAANAKQALVAARQATQEAALLAKQQAEQLATQAAMQAQAQKTVLAQAVPLLNVHSSASVMSGGGATGKPVKSMECDLTGSKEKIAQSLKTCVLQFDSMNR